MATVERDFFTNVRPSSGHVLDGVDVRVPRVVDDDVEATEDGRRGLSRS
jgi:hypothetical protein